MKLNTEIRAMLTALPVVMITFVMSEGVDDPPLVVFESTVQYELKDYYETYVGATQLRYNPFGSMVHYHGAAFISYQQDLIRVPFAGNWSTEADRIEVPRPDATHLTLFRRVLERGVRDDLVLLVTRAGTQRYGPSNAPRTLMRVFDGGERFEDAGTTFYHGTSNGDLEMSNIVGVAGLLFANVGWGYGTLWYAPDYTGPWKPLLDRIWSAYSGSSRFFVDPEDRLVVVSGLSFTAGALGRGILDENFTDWQEEYRHSLLIPDEGKEFTSLARNPLTRTVLAGGGGFVVRSVDAAETFEEVINFGRSIHPPHHSGPRVGVDEDDPGIYPVFRQITYPGQHAHYVLAAAHETYSKSPQNRYVAPALYFSQDDGRTWARLTEHLPDWDHILTPILFLENMPDGHLYLGRLQFREPPNPDEDPFRPFDSYLVVYRVHLPDPAEAFHGMELRPIGWRESDGLGLLYTAWYPWVWNPEQGVWNYAVNAPEGFWAWDEALGWTWSAEMLYPFLYSAERDGYLYYRRGTASPRQFYDVAADAWITDE